MNEIAFILLYVFGSDPEGAHAEADAFWCFSSLIGEVRDLFDFDGLDHAAAGLHVSNVRAPGNTSTPGSIAQSGMAGALRRFSARLKWVDPELWRVLRNTSLDPRIPYYSFRWLACLLSTELSLPSILRIWDAFLAEHSAPALDAAAEASATSKIDFLIDVCCALLVNVREQLVQASMLTMEDADEDGAQAPFARCMAILQAYPLDDPEPVLDLAHSYRQRRRASALTGDGPSLEIEEDEAAMAKVRERAAKMYQSLSSRVQASPQVQNSRAWLRSFSGASTATAVDRSLQAEADEDSTTPQRNRIFQRYADALQSSDAAASISKMSTNLTAKAMTTFNREASPASAAAPQRLPSFSVAGQSFLDRARNASASFTRAVSNPVPQATEPAPPAHPAIGTFAREDLPEFPLPNVGDTPSAKGSDGDSSRQSLRSMLMHGTQDEQGSPTASPSVLPSMRLFNHVDGSKVNGVKPLLLTGSAKPARESIIFGTPESAVQSSRKVSTGPLAAAHSNSNSPTPSTFRQRHSVSPSVGSPRSSFSSQPSEVAAVENKVPAPRSAALAREGGAATVPAAAFFTRGRKASHQGASADDEGPSRPLDPLEHMSVADLAGHQPRPPLLQRSRASRSASTTSIDNAHGESAGSSDSLAVLDHGDARRSWHTEAPSGVPVSPSSPSSGSTRTSMVISEEPSSLAPTLAESVTTATSERDFGGFEQQHARSQSHSSETVSAPHPTSPRKYRLSDAPVPIFEDGDAPPSPSGAGSGFLSRRQPSFGAGNGEAGTSGKLTRSRMASRRTNSSASSIGGAAGLPSGTNGTRLSIGARSVSSRASGRLARGPFSG